MLTLRDLGSAILLAGFLTAASLAQSSPRTASSAPASDAVGRAIAEDVKNLSADDFAARQAALRHLQQLIADQIKQRAQVQEVLNALQQDLAQQERALAMNTDEETQARIFGADGLLEMERGLAGWTLQTMSESASRRATLLAWGLGPDACSTVAKVYARTRHMRLEGIKELAALSGEGPAWTLSRLINDPDPAVRAASCAAAWDRPANADVVTALWFRAVSGPLIYSQQHDHGPDMDAPSPTIHIDFPGGEPLEFPAQDQGWQDSAFQDSQLAGAVLIHLHSPLVAERTQTLLADRLKIGKDLSLAEDPDWTLVTHRLVETYAIKDAIPLLAQEALGADNDQLSGDMNGRPFNWSRRSMAIGTLCQLTGQDTGLFKLIRARDSGDTRGWVWATDVNPQEVAMAAAGPPAGINRDGDGPAVRAFYTWWKVHHRDYGVKEEPSGAAVPPEPRRGARGGRANVPATPVDPDPQ